jgi:hypothetical protein
MRPERVGLQFRHSNWRMGVNYLKPLVNQQVFVYLPGGGVLRGTLSGTADDHIILKCQEEKKGGDKVDLDRFVSRHAIQWVEANKGQRVD